MAAIGLDTLLQTLGEVIHRTVDNILRYVVPGLRQTLFQCVDWLVGLWACLGLQDAPYAVVHDVQIGRIRWPLAVVSLWADVDFDELRHVVADQVLSLFGLVRWGSVLHEHPVPSPIRPSGPWEDFASQKISVTIVNKIVQNRSKIRWKQYGQNFCNTLYSPFGTYETIELIGICN